VHDLVCKPAAEHVVNEVQLHEGLHDELDSGAVTLNAVLLADAVTVPAVLRQST
jgi:hypothetical protein